MSMLCVCVLSRSVMFDSLWPYGLQPTRLLCPWYSPGKNITVVYHFLLLGIFSTAAKSFQSCPTLCNPRDGSPLGSSVPGILQARTLEWVAISFSNAWKWKVKVKSLIQARLLMAPWTADYQASPSMGFSRQEYWSGLPWGSSLTRDQTQVSCISCIGRQILYYWATWEDSLLMRFLLKSLCYRIYVVTVLPVWGNIKL